VVIWTAGDLRAVPPEFRKIAVEAAVQPPFQLNYRRGVDSVTIGWAILLPKPSYAKGENGRP
jgi:hypothetical protein